MVDAKFLAVGHFSDGLAPVKTGDLWGFIDPTGKTVVNSQFDSADVFQSGLARVTVAGKEAYVTTAGTFVVDPFPGRAGVPGHSVQEIWENPEGAERFMFLREGTQIRGYHTVWSYGRSAVDLKGQAAPDGSFSMADESGTSWKGQFVSSILIKGVQMNIPGSSEKESPMRLRLMRDATADEREPLPPASSDWSEFIGHFKNAVQQRDRVALSLMVVRGFADSSDPFKFATPAEVLAKVHWDRVSGALARGVESSVSDAWGRATRLMLDEHPCPGCRYQVRLAFVRDGNKQWRLEGIDYPGH